MTQPESHFTYEKLYALLMAVLSGEVATKQAIRVVRYALEIEALSRAHSDRATGREILLLADALAEPASPRLAATYDALAGEQS